MPPTGFETEIPAGDRPMGSTSLPYSGLKLLLVVDFYLVEEGLSINSYVQSNGITSGDLRG